MAPRGKKRSPKRPRNSSPRGKQKPYFTKRDAFLSRMASIMQVSPERARSFFSQRIVTAIRINNLAGKPDKIKGQLVEQGYDLNPVPWSKNTYIVSNSTKSDLGETDLYKNGYFYIQSLSSMLPVVVLDPQPDEHILDLTAAPGSKTSQIAALTDNQAVITANDNDITRARKMDSLLRTFYVDNVEIAVADGAKYGDLMPKTFDKVLLDAPCSSEGLVYLNSNNPLRFWSIKKVKRMVRTQKDLIVSAYDSLKPGGTLVYSTCTLEPEENEGIVSYLLERFPKASLENISIDSLPEFDEYKQYVKRGIRKWSGREFNSESGKTLRVIPGQVMQGFYVAKITKGKD